MKRTTTIELFKEEMKFSAGHFTIFSASERENLHGHNFTVSVAIEGVVNDNGMLADYGVYKRWVIDRCRAWNETFMLPGESPHLRMERHDGGITAHFGMLSLRIAARAPDRIVADDRAARMAAALRSKSFISCRGSPRLLDS